MAVLLSMFRAWQGSGMLLFGGEVDGPLSDETEAANDALLLPETGGAWDSLPLSGACSCSPAATAAGWGKIQNLISRFKVSLASCVYDLQMCGIDCCSRA